MSELTKRIAVALPAAALTIYLMWLGDWYFKGLILIAALFVVQESIHLFQEAEIDPDLLFPYTLGIWMLLIPDLPHAFQIGMLIFLLFIVLQIVRPALQSLKSYAATLFCGLYGPLGLLAVLMIRNTGEGTAGFYLALALVLMVWGNDVFAYFGGKQFGSRLLAPRISPKKTWEGFVAGVIGAGVGLTIPLYYLPAEFPLEPLQAWPLVLVVSVMGPLGDLTVSKMKRAGDLKDTSDVLPGHGGMLDRLDALILAAPACYLYLYILRTFADVTF